MRLSVAIAVACISIVGLSTADEASAAIRQHTAIATQGLGPALQQLASERDVQFVYRSEVVGDRQTAGASGELTFEEALTKLLEGTGLTYQFLGNSAITIIPLPNATSRREQSVAPLNQSKYGAVSMADSQSTYGGAGSAGVGESVDLWSRFRLAQVDQDQSSGGGKAVQAVEAKVAPTALNEIIVTAQKRQERLKDVPVPVTAIAADTLVDLNILRLQDYYARVPGFNVAHGSFSSYQILSIRGISDGAFTNPTVGVLVDDVPYGASTALGGGQVVPDIDPGDLARVEVLRGPQGTLYGASSMGGLLKFVTVDPSTSDFGGHLTVGLNTVRGGDEVGYNVRASANIPMSDSFAIRASGFTHLDPGYIDNPVRNVDGINEQDVAGGRLSALWQPSDSVSLKVSALFQDTTGDGAPYAEIEAGLGELEQNDLVGTGAYDRKIQAYSAILTAAAGKVDITSVTGYNINEFTSSFDFTRTLGGLAQALFGVTGSPVSADNKTNKLTQEIRLSGPATDKLNWLLGGFYTDEDSHYVQTIDVIDPATGEEVFADALFLSFPTTLQETAIFGDLTIDLTERIDLQVGARQSWIEETVEQTESGPYAPIFTGLPSPVFFPESRSEADAFTYLVTPRFKISDDVMVYARMASGYRVGGPNLAPGGVTPAEYDPDTTQNYEIGLKGDFFDRKLTVDASVYYILWKDIQLQAINQQTRLSYSFNGSEAKSQGIELSIESRTDNGLSIGGWITLSEAELTEDLPPGSVVGASGDTLPFSSDVSANVFVQKDFTISANASGFVGTTVSYVGEREGVFVGAASAAAGRQQYPDYTKVDLQFGVTKGSWKGNLYATNIFDERGIVQGGLGYFIPTAFTYIQPRTFGVSVTKTF